jgi:hypothetical protein
MLIDSNDRVMVNVDMQPWQRVCILLPFDITSTRETPKKETSKQDRLPEQGTATISAVVKLGTQEATFDPCVDLDHLWAMADSDEENVESGVDIGEKTIRGFVSMT